MRSTDDISENLVGHYAGAVTRLAAYAVDAVLSVAIFNVAVAAIVWLVDWFTNFDISSHGGYYGLFALAAWLFVYYWYCFTLSGKTPGKALLGLRVVRGDGSDLGSGHAALRVLGYPLSWALFGLGFAGIVLGRRRRALHDVIADTAVVYDFDARAAHLRFLVRKPRPSPDA
jgi:uncharacterized RDD family membrane protein YckC